MNKNFYVTVKKCSRDTYWYADFIGHVFLVTNDGQDKKRYKLVDGLAWIDKKDAKKVVVEIVNPLEK